MRKSLFTLAAVLFLCGSAWADTFRVHYSIRGSGRISPFRPRSIGSKPGEAARTVSRRSGEGVSRVKG